MARFIYLDGVDEAAVVRFPEGYEVTCAAETGAVNMGRVEIDDLAGSLDVVPRKGAYIVETAAPAGSQRIWTGYIQNATIDRGPYRNGASRIWRADCVDLNFDLTRRAISSGKRGAETDIARITWLLANAALTGLVYSGTLTNLTDNVKNLDEADYTDQKPMDVLADIAPQCGKRAFVFYNESTARAELFYDLADASVNTSSSKISNVVSDLTIVNGAPSGGVWPPFIDGSLERLGEEIASKWRLRWVGGVTTQTRTDTLATYGEYEFATESIRIGRAATAASWVAAQLTAHQGPQDTLTCTLLLPPANVNDIKEGQRLQVKFSHLPDLTAYTYRRVISRIIKVDPSDNYLVQLVLDNATGTAAGGGGTGTFPHQTACDASTGTLVQHATATGFNNNLTVALATAPTSGNLLVMSVTARGSMITAYPVGWTVLPEQGVDPFENSSALFYKIAGSESGSYSSWTDIATSLTSVGGPGSGIGDAVANISEFSGSLDFVDSDEFVSTDPFHSTTVPSAAVTPTSGSLALIVGEWGWKTDLTGNQPTAASGWTLAGSLQAGITLNAMAYKVVSSASGSYTPTLTGPHSDFTGDSHSYGAQSAAFVCNSSAIDPLPGQWVYNETPTPPPGGGNRVFYTAFAYAIGSLSVFVDQVDQTAAVTESDPTTGQFTLAFDPRSWEQITVNYQGAAG